MTCEFVKSARAEAKNEGFDPNKITCDQRQINCTPHGCEQMQARLAAHERAYLRFTIQLKGPDPKNALDSFLVRWTKTRNIQAQTYFRQMAQLERSLS